MKWGIERSKLVTRMLQIPGCKNVINRQYDDLLRLKYKVNWNWVRNPASRRSFHKVPPKLNGIQQRLIEELYATGVATCHIDELFEDQGMWRSLSAEIAAFNSSDEVQSLVRKRQQDFVQKQDVAAVEHYIISKYPQDRTPLISADNPLLRFGLHPLILDVVNSYLGLWSKMIYFDMWHTLPLNTDKRFSSQCWHRDPEDRRKIRTFLYFSDVNANAGAMEYFLGSQWGGPYEHVLRWKDPVRMQYPTDEEVERQIPASQRTTLDGSPGTLIFCDTAGFHRGGIAKTIPRILATSAYVTPASLHRRRYNIDTSVREFPWNAPARFAVS